MRILFRIINTLRNLYIQAGRLRRPLLELLTHPRKQRSDKNADACALRSFR